MNSNQEPRAHFIRQLMTDDLSNGRYKSIVTRFPPEPNGYLHIGHAKSICLNFGLALEFSGKCYFRFDDTNPLKEEEEYVQAAIEDVNWLGFKWCELTYSSDYYLEFYQAALHLIRSGLAYVDTLSMQEIREYRGTLQTPGRDSPCRNRSIEENLTEFARMKAGEYPDGARVLRAKIDMHSGNMNMRDPVLYRVRHVPHQRTGNEWCIYPMYDYAHPLSDAFEHITHSLCTLEFQDHRPLYEWLVQNVPVTATPIQTEFARLNLSHTITSKRKLRELVENNCVSGWNDPRLPTLRGMRERGYPPAAIRQFCEEVGISRSDSVIDFSLLEACVRNVLNQTSKRVMCVLDPIKIIIDNLPAEEVQELQVPFDSNDPESEVRTVPFTHEIYIERSDFMENPPKKYFRLSPGTEVRLRHSYVIRCQEVIYDANGLIAELHCTYDPETLGKNPENRKVKGVIHWVSATYALPVKIMHYDRLFTTANPAADEDLMISVNPDSCSILQGFAEPALAKFKLKDVVQFERLGYYSVNEVTNERVSAFHRVVELKDSWSSKCAS